MKPLPHSIATQTALALCALAGLVSLKSQAWTPLTPAPAIHDIDWRSSPLDLGLRGFNGERFRFRCPPGKALPGQVTGSDPYTDGSSICAAAAHAGAIRMASGGVVTIEVRPGQARYPGTLSHYIRSEDYESFWSGSFLVISARKSS